jgi:Tfp pilus assembly protein PilN
MRAVNLLPRETKRSGTVGGHNLPAVVGAGMGLLVVVTLAGGFLLQSSKVSSAQRSLNQAKEQLAATPLPPTAAKVFPTAAPVVAATQQPLLQAVSSALSQRIAWDRILREFSLVLPSDVWLSQLSLTTPPPAAPGSTAPPTGLQMTGTTYSYGSVARLLTRLSLVPDLSGVPLSNPSRNGGLVEFSLTAGVKGAPAPPAPPTAATTTTTTTTPAGSS